MPAADAAPRSTANSDAAFRRALAVLPGGVNSPVRAFKAVGGTPIFIKEGQGCRVKDVDGNTYIDFVASYGPLIVGHANEQVIAALSKAIGRGTSFGAPTELETQLATTITSALPAVDMVRFVNSGTEAAMSAIRLARAATGRETWSSSASAGTTATSTACWSRPGAGRCRWARPARRACPSRSRPPRSWSPYNDLDAAAALFDQYPGQIACFAVEPVAGNMGVVPPAAGYLAGLRLLCDRHGAMLLFDEVMTGFRVAWGGAQVLYDVRPDLTCLGKVIGGGLPVGAYGGSRQIMEMVSPAGSVYQAGTLSGNPLAMSAGLATLDQLREPGAYETLERRSATLANGLVAAAASAGVPVAVNRVGSMVGLFLTRRDGDRVTDFTTATSGDTAAYATFFHAMLDAGVYLAPAMYEAMFVGLAHDGDAIDRTLAAAERAFRAVRATHPPIA